MEKINTIPRTIQRTVISKDEIMGLIIDLETKTLEEVYQIYFGGRIRIYD